MLEIIVGIPHKTIPIIAYVDNKSVTEVVYSTKLVDDKRLRVDIAEISESLTRTEVSEIKWCPGNIHLADCITKRGAAGYNLLHVLKDGTQQTRNVIVTFSICFNLVTLNLTFGKHLANVYVLCRHIFMCIEIR